MAEDLPDLDEQAALLALDALTEAEQADAELRHGTFPDGLAPIAAALAEAVDTAPPSDLRERTLARALARRPAATPADPPARCSSVEAFDRTIAEFFALLESLDDEEWLAPAHDEHGPVRDVVAHLVGVEELNLRWLDPDGERTGDDARLDHVTATRPAVAALAGTAPREVARRWHDAVRAVADSARRSDPARPVSFHDLTTSVDGLLVMRTFELWAHGMDIALATGRPMPTLDDERMAMLSGRLMAALPLALAYRGRPQPGRRARFVLTGRAGGCYDVPLGRDASAATPDATIVVDAVDLCRVAARRLAPADLNVDVEGDARLADAVLAAVDAFARD